MKWNDKALEARDYEALAMPFALYCAISTCNVIIMPGMPAKKYDGATYTHVNCPKSPHKNYAAHKQPRSAFRNV